MNLDSLSCQGIPCEAQIGFKPSEQNLKQTLLVDFKAALKPISKDQTDQVSGIKLDYFEAYKQIKALVSAKAYNLIETVAHDVAELLLNNFSIESVQVHVTKKPQGMEDVQGVTYSCELTAVVPS